MISLKTEKEIKIMKEGGKKLAWVFNQVLREIKPGVRLRQLDSLAEKLIEKQGGTPSFKTVQSYKWATCININQGVVHGIPNDYRIKKGDLVSLDMGMLYRGFHTDMARTLCVRTKNEKLKTKNLGFLEVGRRALKMATEAAKVGNHVGHISVAIEKEIRKAGFSPIEVLTGHGVGKNLHEEPQIPCLLKEEIEKTPLLKSGMTLAIEVIYAENNPQLVVEEDGWTIKTADNGLAGLFEDTILITKKSSIILTPLETRLELC